MTGRRGIALGLVLAGVGFAIVLMLPGRDRVLALFSLLLLWTTGATGTLLLRLRRVMPAPEDVFRRPPPDREQRPLPQLDEIVHDVETVLELGHDAHGDLGARLRIVAAARLADRRGIDLDGQPERARRAVADELTWALAHDDGRDQAAGERMLGAAELHRALESLERI